MKKAIIVIMIAGAVLTLSCTKKMSENELYVEKLRENYMADRSSTEHLKEYMLASFEIVGDDTTYIKLFEENESILQDDIVINIYYGMGMARMAGRAEDISEKLKWVKKAIIKMDAMVELYPEEKLVYLWRGYMYTNFPDIMNVKENAEEDLAYCLAQRDKGIWKLEKSELGTIFDGYRFIALNYSDPDYLEGKYALLRKEIPDNDYYIYSRYDTTLSELRKKEKK